MSAPAAPVIPLAPARWAARRFDRDHVVVERWLGNRLQSVDIVGRNVLPLLVEEDAGVVLFDRASCAEYMAGRPWPVFLALLDALGVAHRFRAAEAIPYTVAGEVP